MWISTKGGVETGRFLAPAGDGQYFINFAKPGWNTIHATVVWPTDSSKDFSPETILFDRDDRGRFKATVLEERVPRLDSIDDEINALSTALWRDQTGYSHSGIQRRISMLSGRRDQLRVERGIHLRASFMYFGSLSEVRELSVDVPAEAFGQCWRMTKWLGTRFRWSRPAVDQCMLRRRAIVTALLAVPLALLAILAGAVVAIARVLTWLASLVCVAFLLIAGIRRINYAPLTELAAFNPAETWEYAEKSVWWYKKTSTRYDRGFYQPRNQVRLLLNPPVGLAVTLLTLAGVYFTTGGGSWKFSGFLILCQALLALFVLAIASLRNDASNAVRAEEQEARERIKEARRLRELEAALRAVTCDSTGSLPSGLPSGRPTPHVRLVIADVKGKFCKPMARG